MLEIKLSSKRLQKKLRAMPGVIAIGQREAMRKTTKLARDAARVEASKVFDNPTPSTIKAIENRFPTVNQMKSGKGTAAVFVKDFMADEILPNVHKRTETRVPKSSRTIIEPARNTRVNRFGNITGLRAGRIERLRKQRDKYLHVPVNSKAKSTRHLTPGLYRILGGQNRGRLTRAGNSKAKLRLLYTYQERRVLREQKFRRYPTIVTDQYRKHYGPELRKAVGRELRRL